MRGLFLAAAVATAAAQPSPQLQTLFSSNYSAYPTCYRQPVLSVVNETHLIAFIEGRNNTWCSGTNDGSPSSIRLKTSSDGGATWSAREQVLYTGGVDFLSAVHDAVVGRTFLFIQLGSSTLLATSDDAGATWTAPAKLPVAAPAGYSSAQPGVAHGIQVSGALCSEPTCGGVAGRLLVSFICHGPGSERVYRGVARGDVACPGCYTCLLLSDDHGKSWRIGAVADQQEGSREASLVQLHAGAYPGAQKGLPIIFANERNMGNETGSRLMAVSLDGGASFALQELNPAIPDGKTANWTGIVSGATRFDGPGGAPARVVISVPANRTARQDMALYASTDETATWSAGKLYRAGPAGYSDCAALNATHGAILFENGDHDDEFDFATRVSFGYFTAQDL